MFGSLKGNTSENRCAILGANLKKRGAQLKLLWAKKTMDFGAFTSNCGRGTESLGVDFPFFSTIVLCKNRSGGILERRMPGFRMEMDPQDGGFPLGFPCEPEKKSKTKQQQANKNVPTLERTSHPDSHAPCTPRKRAKLQMFSSS